MIDLGSKGPRFTWRGGVRNGYGRVYERLDRCFGNVEWRQYYQDATVLVLPRVKSDHHPILVELEEQRERFRGDRKPFRFEAAWLHHDEFAEFLRKGWETGFEVPKALEKLTADLKVWNRDVYENIFQRKRRVLARLGGVQKDITWRGNPFFIQIRG